MLLHNKASVIKKAKTLAIMQGIKQVGDPRTGGLLCYAVPPAAYCYHAGARIDKHKIA